MARIGTVCNNMSKGVIDPLIGDRFDVNIYNQALKTGTNAWIIPQGGATRRPGLVKRARMRHTLRRLQLRTVGGYNPGVTLSAVNGGTTANAVDQSDATVFTTTGTAVANVLFEVFRIQLAAVTAIAAVDLRGFKCSASAADSVLFIQTSSDGTLWNDFGRGVNLRTAARTRRFADGPGGSTVDALYVRVVVKLPVGATSTGTMAFNDIALWQETAKLSPIRRCNFKFDLDQTYMCYVTDHNVDVFRFGEWQAAIPIPHRADHIAEITQAQSRDALLLFHVDVPPHMTFRQGAHWEWDSYAQTFTNVPTLVSGTSFGNAQDEIQRVTIAGIQDGDGLSFWLEDIHSIPATKSQVLATVEASIQAALNSLTSVPTVTVESATPTTLVFRLKFSGGAGSRVWQKVGVDVWRDTASVSVDTVQDGRAATGTLMSAQTGWPRCGCFHQSRLVLGGFRLRPETVIMSMTALYFDFNPATVGGAAAAMQFALDTDEVAIIRQVFVGRHLQVFTNSSEWYISERVLDATKTLSFVATTAFGTKAGLGAVQVEGSTLFIQASGDVVREFLYSDVEQDYSAPAASLLGSHLISGIRSIEHRRAATTTEGSQVFLTNSDGSGVLMTLLKDEKVNAMTPIVTDGSFLDIGVDAARRLYAIVQRTAGGVTDNYLEEFSTASLLDASVAFALPGPQAVIYGLDHLEGKSAWVIADGMVLGPFQVSNGAMTLDRAVISGEVGLNYAFEIEPMTPIKIVGNGQVLLTPRRIHDVTLSLQDTTSIAVGANNQAPAEVALRGVGVGGNLLDVPPLANPFTGTARIEGLLGHAEKTTCRVTQTQPGRATVRAIYMEAS